MPRCGKTDLNPLDPDQKPGTDDGKVAVALSYDLVPGEVPRIVASGRGTVAETILALAFAQGVKVREDADLAQLLSVVEVGAEIPLEAFVAVAEVLNYVYRANGLLPPEPPAHEVEK